MTQALFSPLAIAPMIDWTYTHFRVLMRLLAPHALLYTDMQTPSAIKYNVQRSLGYHPIEQPLALQLGGADPKSLAESAQLAEKAGFVEVNLNLGCPSDRVQSGRFGACLMQDPQRVKECIVAMKEAVTIPVTAKVRIGVDHDDSYDFFATFVELLDSVHVDKLIVHARKAWLSGLSPKQNRTIPPLHYPYVYAIKQAFPALPMVINGNVQTIDAIDDHLEHVDGVMLGRLACQDPYMIARIHHHLYPETSLVDPLYVIEAYTQYAESMYRNGVPISILLKPIFNFMHASPGVKQWKAALMSIQQRRQWEDIAVIFRGICKQFLVH